MPYLEYENKKDIDDNGASDVYNKFEKLEIKEFAGAINYINFKIVKKYIDRNGKRYFTFAVVIGTLVCCILEIYRRLVANYEDKKIIENGDVY